MVKPNQKKDFTGLTVKQNDSTYSQFAKGYSYGCQYSVPKK